MKLEINKEVEKRADIFKALSSTTRLNIVFGLIEKKECSVNAIAEMLGIPQPNISQHLGILKNAGIIEGYRNGTQICYRIVDEQTEKVVRSLEICP